jgi:pimeloyl-ACP methyl ester carboxylesterase
MPEIYFRGVRTFYRTWGSGRTVVLLHSGGSSSAQWTRVAEPLSYGYHIIAPDFLGFGETSAWPVEGGLTHDLQADLVAGVLDASGSASADVVGHSYGGATAVRLALRRPELVRSLVLIEPIIAALLDESGDLLYVKSIQVALNFIASVEAGEPEKGWERFIDSRSGAGTWAAMPDARKARFLAQSAQTKEGFISNRNNRTTLAEIRSLSVPVSIIRGEHAIPEDRRVAEILAETITHARSATIWGAGHMSPLTHPADVGHAILAHISGIPSADTAR